MPPTNTDYLKVRVVTPEGEIFSGQPIAISSINKTGKFSILPGHAPFITLIYDTILMHTDHSTAKEISITYGILACDNNQVEVYGGFITPTQSLPELTEMKQPLSWLARWRQSNNTINRQG